MMNDFYSRTLALIGENSLDKLKNSAVAVFGIGGVGSYVIESLARSGVGTIYIYDNDTVNKSNINRQLVALNSTIGELKTSVAKLRCKDINPDINIIDCPLFVTPDTDIPFLKFDFIVDAVDNVTAKLFLTEKATEFNVPIISVMGTGNKLHPEKLKISDIYETKECPLCKVMRCELKKRGIKKLSVVWSDEHPIKPYNTDKERIVASMSFVPAAAGMIASSYVVRNLIK